MFMRLLKFVFPVLCIFSIVVSCNESSPDKSTVLKFNLEKGKTYNFSMNIDMKNEMEGQKMTSDMDFEYDMEVIDEKTRNKNNKMCL